MLKTHAEIVEDYLQCKHSLDVAVEASGGQPLGIDNLKSMTAYELLVLIAPNGIRFFSKEKKR